MKTIKCASWMIALLWISVLTSSVAEEARRIEAPLISENPYLRRRAVQELFLNPAWHAQLNWSVAAAITNVQMEGFDCIALFSRIIREDPDGLRPAMLNTTRSIERLLCYAAGNSGTVNSNVITVLRQHSGKGAFYSGTDIAARVALAKLGIDENETLGQIHEAFATNAPISLGLVNALCLVQPRPHWIARLTSIKPMLLSKDIDVALGTALLAAACGTNGSYCLPYIQKKAVEDRLPGTANPLWFRFAARRLVNPDGQWITDDLLKQLGSVNTGFDHTVATVLLQIQYLLIKEEDFGSIASGLDDGDPEVVVGACRLCWALGLRANSLERQLLKVAETTSSPDCREAAFHALSATGSAETLPALLRFQAGEKDTEGARALKEALTLIQATGRTPRAR